MQQSVIQRPNDPNIYLLVMGEWYGYNPNFEPLGSGAMGTVYKGFRCRTGEPIAVKRVKDYYANVRSIRERARQEASLAFRHPNLVEMIGYCEYAPTSGPIFIVSKMVQGITLDKYIKENMKDRFDRVEKICHAMFSVLDALEYVHSRGVIHRDIKPSNIMIENGMNVRLMDLGIARMSAGNSYSSFGFIGTPQYSAPEQILRSEENHTQIDASTDIYELGITFYELLTGINPFDSNNEADTLVKQMKEKLPPNSNIPPRLMSVLLKATEKNQSERYQTALDFKNAIEDALSEPPSPIVNIMNWIDHNSFILGCVIGIVAAAILLILL